MNICFYTSCLPNPLIGGVERVTYNLSEYLKGQGINVFFLTSDGTDHCGKINYSLSQSEKIQFINDYLDRYGIDIVIDQYGSIPYLKHPFISEKHKIVRCVHTNVNPKFIARCLFETFFLTDLRSRIFNLACYINSPRRIYRSKQYYKNILTHKAIDRLVLLSEKYIPYLQNKYHPVPERICAIPNACEERLLNVGDCTEKKKQIVWCGRIVHNPKNVLFLVKLWKALYQKFPDWEMILVGDGCDRNLVERKISMDNLERISITGFDEPYQYFKDASIFVLPSYSEGFPMVLLEAMAHGCVPIVFNNTPAFSDIIDDGKNGIIVHGYKPEKFIRECEQLMSDSEKCRGMAENARLVASKFSMEKIGAMWLSLFKKLTDKE